MALHLIPRYFFSYRVTAKDDGEKKLPKRSTAEAVRSRLKQEIIDKHQVDVFDACLFPEARKKWKAYVSMIAKAGRNETTHHEEVNPTTMLAIYRLLAAVVKAVKARGSPNYEEVKAQIPARLQERLHVLLQLGAMFVLNMFEVRRGAEGIEFLKATDFKEVADHLYEFKYVRKCVPELEKNNQEGSNTKCHGVIPDMVISEIFNPFTLFTLYMSLLPGPNKQGVSFLFPKARGASKIFNPHDPEVRLFEINMKGGASFGQLKRTFYPFQFCFNICRCLN